MRRLVVLVTASAMLVAFAAACAGRPAGVTATASASATPSLRDARLARACADAQKTINESTAHFNGRLADAVAANERGDTAGRDRAIVDIRVAFANWSSSLRAQADRADDAELKAVLTEYAGAVDAAISRVRSAADLDRLYTFDDQELDTVASRLAGLCG
jgi:hypothetical protein